MTKYKYDKDIIDFEEDLLKKQDKNGVANH